MGNFNKVMVMGNLTKDPVVRGADRKVTFITIAVNNGWNDRETGERVEKATYIDCKAFDTLGENIAKWFSKGRPIFVEGRLVLSDINSKYLADDTHLKTMKVEIRGFEFCDKKKNEEVDATPADMSVQDHSDFDSLLNEEEDFVMKVSGT